MASYPFGFRVAQAVGNIAALSTITTPALILSQKEDNPPVGLLAKQWRNLFENGKSKNPPVAVGVTSAFIYLAWSVRSGGSLIPKDSYQQIEDFCL
ncbi:DUF1772-domain-containing protein [Penicillium waksmanii]|uniref:DUF1772-domain-containing protein n=1 Tax=Penicillium waksmanii TaxID=69791 RepID=UPI0025481DA0|nr:DUF1772-domain-containing protein [Penicillium waksmanii]KAJ6000717.1 DUF1772-domain-containing protein [Penicillium waksmanii]